MDTATSTTATSSSTSTVSRTDPTRTGARVESIHPVVVVHDVDRTQAFYTELLDLPTTFDADWFVQLRDPGRLGGIEIAAVAEHHPTIPAGWAAAGNVLVTVEVDDATLVRERARAMELELVMELRDETFGQRHFMVADPNGVLVDIVQYLFVPDSER